MNKEKKRDLLIVTLMFLVGVFISLKFYLSYTPGVLLYAGIPALYLSIKKTSLIKKTLLFSVLMSIPIVFVFDYIMHVSEIWYIVSTFGLRVFGVFPIDTFIWGFVYTYYVVAFYEYFLDRDVNKEKFSKRWIYLVYILVAMAFVFGLIFLINKDLLIMKRFYIVFIFIFFIAPIVFVVNKNPKLISKLTLITLYFAIWSIIYELAALYLGHWTCPGQHYIGWVELFGFGFSFEELLWLIFAVPGLLCIYEFFADDTK